MEDHQGTECGFGVMQLASQRVTLRCAPELGGRVFSLVDRRTGREWLWRKSDGPALFRPTDANDFGTGCFAGLDECIPTVGACVWTDGRALADHGDFWARAWTVEERGKDSFVLAVDSPSLGLRLVRRISLDGVTVRFEYTLENRSNRVAPALWAMHPLFTIEPGDRLELPAEVRSLTVAGARPPLNSPVVPFSSAGAGPQLSALELADMQDGYLKAFTPRLPPGVACAAIRNAATGDGLAVHWSTAFAPFLGIWLTRGGYRGWHHVALEPTQAPYDHASAAAADPGTAAAVNLQPGARFAWWVEWRLPDQA